MNVSSREHSNKNTMFSVFINKLIDICINRYESRNKCSQRFCLYFFSLYFFNKSEIKSNIGKVL